MQITKDVKLWLNDKFESKTKKKMDRSEKKVGDLDNTTVPNTKHALLVTHINTENHAREFRINCILIILLFRIKRIEQVECLIARERKQNNLLDCEIAALKVNIDERNFAKNYLIDEKDIITRNQRYAFIASVILTKNCEKKVSFAFFWPESRIL